MYSTGKYYYPDIILVMFEYFQLFALEEYHFQLSQCKNLAWRNGTKILV